MSSVGFAVCIEFDVLIPSNHLLMRNVGVKLRFWSLISGFVLSFGDAETMMVDAFVEK